MYITIHNSRGPDFGGVVISDSLDFDGDLRVELTYAETTSYLDAPALRELRYHLSRLLGDELDYTDLPDPGAQVGDEVEILTARYTGAGYFNPGDLAIVKDTEDEDGDIFVSEPGAAWHDQYASRGTYKITRRAAELAQAAPIAEVGDVVRITSDGADVGLHHYLPVGSEAVVTYVGAYLGTSEVEVEGMGEYGNNIYICTQTLSPGCYEIISTETARAAEEAAKVAASVRVGDVVRIVAGSEEREGFHALAHGSLAEVIDLSSITVRAMGHTSCGVQLAQYLRPSDFVVVARALGAY